MSNGKFMFKRFLLVLLVLQSSLAADLRPFVKHIEAINADEVTLANGMKVVLKKTTFDKDEIYIRVSAPKGYVYLAENLRPAAKNLHEILWESGIGSRTGDQLSVDLFEKGLELSFEIGPAERYIEGEGRSDASNVLLQLIHDLFLVTHIDPKQLSLVKDRLKESVERRACDVSCQFDAFFYRVNTLGYRPLEQIPVSAIDLITVENFQKVLMGAFQDPSEFVAVIVGDFETDAMLGLVEKTLGAIPVTKRPNIWTEPPILSFPKGTETNTLPQNVTHETLTRISFPINEPINETNIRVLDLLTETIEVRLREELMERYRNLYSLDVSYEFPLYPFMDRPWITIQYRSDKGNTQVLTQLILDQLKELKTKGISDDDLAAAEVLKNQSDDYWNSDNQFWLATLSQYYMMGWDKERIVKNYSENKVEKEQVVNALRTYFPIDNYTIVTGGS